MCGFAGVVVWDERYRVSPETLRRMSAAVAHRGPDGEGLRLTHENQPISADSPQVALAFRRLAILDPDPRSMQPFTDGRRWLVFNGEIYNFRELRAELSALRPEHAWRTTGDTEVLLAAYAEWGENCVEKLNGMFAFAVWDERERTLFTAVDRMGQKPLYWSAICTDGVGWTGVEAAASSIVTGKLDEGAIVPNLAAIAFGSELSSLLPCEWVNRGVDWRGIGAYLRWGYIPAPQTGFVSVRKFGPGRQGTLWSDRATTSRYFDSFTQAGTADDPAKTTREVISSAVARQMVSDVPIGCLLSGGMDSSVVAAAMQAVDRGRPIHTFTIGFDDPRYDESNHAAAVAKHLGTDHHAFFVKPDVAADLISLASVFGEPFGDSSALPTHYLARETRGHVTVALGGDGGDELFGGYDRYRAMHIAAGLDQAPAMLRKAAASEVWQRLPGSHPKSPMTRLKRFLSSVDALPVHRYLQIMSLVPDPLIADLTRHDDRPIFESGWVYAAMLTERMADASAAPAVAAFDRQTYLPGDLLTKVDRCSMLHGLEVRSPFMDPDVVTFAAGLTTDQLLKGGPKRMLREAFADDLPAWVFKRRKMGFAVPIGDWFRGPLRGMLRDTLFSAHAFGRSHFDMKVVQRLVDEHESKRVDHAQRLYALLMLELWWDTVRTEPSGSAAGPFG